MASVECLCVWSTRVCFFLTDALYTVNLYSFLCCFLCFMFHVSCSTLQVVLAVLLLTVNLYSFLCCFLCFMFHVSCSTLQVVLAVLLLTVNLYSFLCCFVPCVTVLFHSSGCISGIAPHLIELIPFLVNSLSDKRVRNLMKMSH